MNDKFFFTIKGVRQEPATMDELKVLAARQELRRSDLLWTEGMSGWQRAGLTSAIFDGLPPDLEPLEQHVSSPPQAGDAQKSSNVMAVYLETLEKYAVFEGRATRQEFWTFYVVSIAIALLLILVEWLIGIPGILSGLYSFGFAIPIFAVGVRRMHDTGRSGWWVLLGIVNLIFWAEEGNRGANRFGPDPKTVVSSSPNHSENGYGMR